MPRHPPYALISLISVIFFLSVLVSFLTSSFQVNHKTYFLLSFRICMIHLLVYSYSYYLSSFYMQLSMCVTPRDEKSIKYEILLSHLYASGISFKILGHSLQGCLAPFGRQPIHNTTSKNLSQLFFCYF